MKRSDLTIGQEYMANPAQDWDRYTSGARRVRILEFGWGAGPRFQRDGHRVVLSDGSTTTVMGSRNGGAMVLVEYPDARPDLAWDRAAVVPLSHIRMPWAEWEQRRQAILDAREQERREQDERAAQRREHRASTVARLQALAIPGLVYDREGGYQVPRETMDALLDLAERGAKGIDL